MTLWQCSEKLIGRLFSQANNRKKQRQADAHQEAAKALRLFRGRLRALVAANETGTDALDVIDRQVGWYKLLQAKHLVEAMVHDAEPESAFSGFFENFLYGLHVAQGEMLPVYYKPTNRKSTMVATNDIGAEVATLLTGPAWSARASSILVRWSRG